MNYVLFYKKIQRLSIFVIICSFLFICALKTAGFVFTKSQVNRIQQGEPEDIAYTDINLTLFEDTVIYERTTHTNPTDIPLDMENVRRTEVIVTWTTHSDLM